MREIFVFGSNLAGRHGRGAALYARQHHGAVYGVGLGPQGDSYAIPTKDKNIQTLDLKTIGDFVNQFKIYADVHPELIFNVTAIGCGLAGYSPRDIAPMFKNMPSNVKLPDEFLKELNEDS